MEHSFIAVKIQLRFRQKSTSSLCIPAFSDAGGCAIPRCFLSVVEVCSYFASDKREITWVGPGRIAQLDVDLDQDLPPRVDEGGLLESRVAGRKLGADGQNGICAGNEGIGGREAEGAEDAQRKRVVFRKDSLAAGSRSDRRADSFRELPQLPAGVTDVHAVSRNDDRPAGFAQLFNYSFSFLNIHPVLLPDQITFSCVHMG
jgi:hypothetical protein